MLPRERRVQLEVTTDGRHLTFILVSLYEAGYGVQVYGGDWFFRELMLLRKTAPIPFLYGGKETECGVSMSDSAEKAESGNAEKLKQSMAVAGNEKAEHLCDSGELMADGRKKTMQGAGSKEQGAEFLEHSTLASRPSSLFVLDYNYFSGLLEKVEPPIALINTDREPRNTRIDTKGEAQGCARGTRAGASEPDSLASELADSPVSGSLTRSASGPAAAAVPPRTDAEYRMAGKALDPRPSPLDASAPATSHSLPATAPQALRMPYFMHPSVYHRGLHKRRERGVWRAERGALDTRRSSLDFAAKRRRRFRLGFFGTHDREFYTKHYHFPGMNRFEILEVFLQKFGDRMTRLQGCPKDWNSCEMAVSIDERGGDRKGKSFLSQEHYFAALRECDFVLSPPGWCMPVSHNLVESMFCGAIPITNGGAFMAEPPKTGKTCLEFQDVESFVSVINLAMAMDENEVARMRNAVRDYYARFLEPKSFAESVIHAHAGKILVNAEENSVPFI